MSAVPGWADPVQAGPFLTLCFLRSNFGEEGDLSHGHERQTQNLQKDSDDELSQLPGKTTYKTERKNNQLIREFVIYFPIYVLFLH